MPTTAMASTTRVGHYLMSETLGQGSFGKVKLAKHAVTQKECAIKILDKSDIRSNDLTTNVRREIAIMKALNHRNIVNLVEVLSSKHKLFIVMDLVRGGELFEMIERQGEIPESLARKYFQQLVDGVDYCHQRGIVHRDLKPENLLVDENGTLKITDFGVSSMKGLSHNLLFTQCGTPYYAAPEILMPNNGGYNGQKVDAWSCGVILFLLLSGQLPFMEENMTKLYDDIREVRIAWPSEIKGEPKALITHLLTKDPEMRYDLSDVKRHPWYQKDYEQNRREFEIIDAGGTLPPPPTPAPTIPRTNGQAYRSPPQRMLSPPLPSSMRHNSPTEPHTQPIMPSARSSLTEDEVAVSHNVTALANGRSSARPPAAEANGISTRAVSSVPNGTPAAGSVAARVMRWGSDPDTYNGRASAPIGEREASPEREAVDEGQREVGSVQHAAYQLPNGPGRADRTSGEEQGPGTNAVPKDSKNILNYYQDKSLRHFIEDALPGKPPKKIDEVVRKLESIDIDCVMDIHVVVESTGSKDAFIRWLEEKSDIPTVTSMRIARIFFY